MEIPVKGTVILAAEGKGTGLYHIQELDWVVDQETADKAVQMGYHVVEIRRATRFLRTHEGVEGYEFVVELVAAAEAAKVAEAESTEGAVDASSDA